MINQWRAISVIVFVVVATLIVVANRRGGPNNANHPEGVVMICGGCGHTWRLTMRQISDHHVAHYGEPLPCPVCGALKGTAAAKDPDTQAWVRQDRIDSHTPVRPDR